MLRTAEMHGFSPRVPALCVLVPQNTSANSQGLLQDILHFEGNTALFNISQTLREPLIQASSQCNIRLCYISLDDIISLQRRLSVVAVKSNEGKQIRVVV